MKKTLNLLLFILAILPALTYGQRKYELGRYQIDPTNKTISVLTGFSKTITDGDGQERGHGWGERYIVDSTINFESTSLFVFGNQFVLKEHFQNWNLPPQLDVSSFRIIYNGLGYKRSLSRDDNFIYRNSIGAIHETKWESIDLTGYQTISDFIYKKENILYFLSKDFILKEVKGVKLHIPTLKHIMGNYFADKNGLYLLGGYRTMEYEDSNKQWVNSFREGSVLLEKSKRKKITPVIHTDYFIYKGKVYSSRYFDENKPLPLNVSKLKEIELRWNYGSGNSPIVLLADDSQTFISDQSRGYETFETNNNDRWFVNNSFFSEQVNQWQVINQKIYKDDDGETLYIPSELKPAIKRGYMGILVAKQNDFYTFTFNRNDSLSKFRQVLIFNYDIQDNEIIDLDQYRYLSEDLWIYKGRLYLTDKGLPSKEMIETEKLNFLTLHNAKTNYLSNGSKLIYVGNIRNSSIGESTKKMQVLGSRIVSNVDFATLKVLSMDILIDKSNIYIGDYQGVRIIPIDKLGIEIKAFTE